MCNEKDSLGFTKEQRIKMAGDKLCAWWKHVSETEKGHFDNIGYKQGLRDSLEIMKQHHLISDYSLETGVIIK